MIEVTECLETNDEVVAAMARLIPQLSSSSAVPTHDVIESIVASDASHLLLARNERSEIVGSMTLVVFPIPTGVRAWIEDVVVDSETRGQGVGEKLNRHALDIAESRGARTVDLTSRPTREAANRLYQRLGFVARETNVYRYSMD